MKQHLTTPRLVIALGLIAVGICISSFRQGDSTRQKTFRDETFRQANDTTKPGKRNRGDNEFRVNDLDNALRHLDEQMLKLDEHMKKIDFNKMERDINESISKSTKVDVEKIAIEVEASLAKIDKKKMEAQMESARKHMSELDWEKSKLAIDEAVKKIKEVDIARKKQDVAKAQSERSIGIDKDKIKRDVNKAMSEAKESMEKTRNEMRNFQEFTNALQSDGLIQKNKPYKIEVKNNELYINEVKQPQQVIEKYKKYFKKGNFTMKNNNEGVYV